jgi:quercetin dioxygenase-like cupin family protein
MYVTHGRLDGKPSETRTATFTGTVHMDPVLTAPEVLINNVIFTPGARTYWHVHPGGQLLIVTAGRGIVATREESRVVTQGDVIWTGHGASGGTLLVHTAVSHGTAEWHGEVGESDYEAANNR